MSEVPVSLPLRILIADPDPHHRREARAALERAGYEILVEVGDGVEAVHAARRFAPQIALLEVTMPGLDGIEVASILQREKIAPTVLLTACSEPEQVKRAAEAGVFNYLVKPFREASLVSAIEMTYSQWTIARGLERKIERLQAREETRALVDCAKQALMAACGISETRAYRLIQLRSMNTRRSMREVAQAILQSGELLRRSPEAGARSNAIREKVA